MTAENTIRDDGVVEVRECGFMKVNPFTRNLARHAVGPGEPLVNRFVALVAPDDTFFGDGAEVWVCLSCAAVLDQTYKATTPRRLDGSDAEPA